MKAEKEILLHEFGHLVKQSRTRAKMSRAQLAEATGLDVNYIGYIERGDREIGLCKVINLAKHMDISLDEFVSSSENS